MLRMTNCFRRELRPAVNSCAMGGRGPQTWAQVLAPSLGVRLRHTEHSKHTSHVLCASGQTSERPRSHGVPAAAKGKLMCTGKFKSGQAGPPTESRLALRSCPAPPPRAEAAPGSCWRSRLGVAVDSIQ